VGRGVATRDYVVPDNVAGEAGDLCPASDINSKVVVFKEIIRPGYRAVYKD
jgi:hypothetical protein